MQSNGTQYISESNSTSSLDVSCSNFYEYRSIVRVTYEMRRARSNNTYSPLLGRFSQAVILINRGGQGVRLCQGAYVYCPLRRRVSRMPPLIPLTQAAAFVSPLVVSTRQKNQKIWSYSRLKLTTYHLTLTQHYHYTTHTCEHIYDYIF